MEGWREGREHVENKKTWMLLAWISIIIPRWLELSLDKWSCWVVGMLLCVCWDVYCFLSFWIENKQLQNRKIGKNVIEVEISCSSGTVFLISPGYNWLRTPLPMRHQCSSCQSETSGQPLVVPSSHCTIIYLRLDTHTNMDIHSYTHTCVTPPSQIHTLSLTYQGR